MLRIDKNENRLVRLKKSALAEADKRKRHLQSMICKDPDSFFEELGESLCLVRKFALPTISSSE